MMAREEAYKYLLRERQGERESIIKNIGEDLFTELRLVGFIKEGMDGNWVQRWQITSLGDEQMSSYIEFNEMDKELEKICAELEISC